MLCVATKILNLKAIPSNYSKISNSYEAVRCNKNTKSESYSQLVERVSACEVRCALQQKY